jgi:type I restriction enzyme S subunit
MRSEWPTVRLGDYCQKIGSGATPAGGSGVYLDQGEICLIRSQNIHNEGFKPQGLVFITANAANKLKNVIVERNDILLNITGDSVARVCLAREEFLPARVNQHVAIIRPYPKEFDPRYLRYLLSSPAMQNFLLTIAAVGATRNALTKGMIETIEVSKPPIKIQAAIADQLESLDKKIHLNTQTNQTMESIAQAIFKSWFVDFDPVKAKMAAKERWYAMQSTSESASPVCYADEAALPDLETYTNLAAMCAISGKNETELAQLQQQNPDHYQQLAETAALFPSAMVDSELGEIPEGWEVSEIGNEVEIVGGGTPSTNEPAFWDDGELHWTTPKDLSNKKSKILLDTERKITNAGLAKISSGLLPIDTVLMSSRAPVGYLALAKIPVAINQGYIAMKCTGDLSPEFIILWAESVMDEILQRASGTTFAEISKKNFRNIKLIRPTTQIAIKFEEKTSPLFTKIAATEMQSTDLANIRDSLLPKLLSGEIDLTKIENEVI